MYQPPAYTASEPGPQWAKGQSVHEFAFYSRRAGTKVFVNETSSEKYHAFKKCKSPIVVDLQTEGIAMPLLVLKVTTRFLMLQNKGCFWASKPPSNRRFNDKTDMEEYGTFTLEKEKLYHKYTLELPLYKIALYGLIKHEVYEFSLEGKIYRWVKQYFPGTEEDYCFRLFELGKDQLSVVDTSGSVGDFHERIAPFNSETGPVLGAGVRQLAEMKCVFFTLNSKTMGVTFTVLSEPVQSVKDVDAYTKLLLCMVLIMMDVELTRQYLCYRS